MDRSFSERTEDLDERVSSMMWWHDGGWGAGAWFVMSLMMVLFWGGLIALVAWLVHSLRADSNRPPAPAAPQVPTQVSTQVSTGRADELLAERFARGEIDEDEFRRRRDVLHGVRE